MLCHGVTRKGDHGLPTQFIQEEVKIKKGQLEDFWTTNEAVLKGKPKTPNLVASSVYEIKPVQYLSVVSYDLKCVVTEKYVFNVDMGRNENLVFLWMNTIFN